jgi:hypothetical protein
MTADVDWPNAWEGGRVHGPEGVRDDWTRQWAAIDPTVKPIAFTTRSDGSVAVEVNHLAHSLGGKLLGEGRILQLYVFRDDLVARMDVEEVSSKDRRSAGKGGCSRRRACRQRIGEARGQTLHGCTPTRLA